MAFRGTAGGVEVMSAEVATEVKRFSNRQIGKVLVTESNDFALSN
jgi:hypothetical protein